MQLLMIVLTTVAACREERVWLAGPRGHEYRAYQRKTGMFLPFVARRVMADDARAHR